MPTQGDVGLAHLLFPSKREAQRSICSVLNWHQSVKSKGSNRLIPYMVTLQAAEGLIVDKEGRIMYELANSYAAHGLPRCRPGKKRDISRKDIHHVFTL
jgi:hypothetical protein